MYPQRELTALREAKARLRRRIATHRAECSAHTGRVLRPLRWFDRLSAQWRRLAPLTRLAAVPLGLWLTRSMARRGHLLGRLMRWGPALFSLARGFGRTVPR